MKPNFEGVRLSWLAVCVAALVILAGCSSSKSRVGGVLNLDSDLKLTFVTADNINPDHSDNPSPVIIRMYELNSPVAFQEADFIDLYEQDKKVLGDTLVTKRTFRPIVPGEQREETLVLAEGTTHVALYAEFSQYRNSTYQVVFPITQNNVFRNTVTVRISGNHLVIEE